MSVQSKKRFVNVLILAIFIGWVGVIDAAPSRHDVTEHSAGIKEPYSKNVVLKPFNKHSLTQIMQDRIGQAFIMVLWSIDCPPCLKELEHFQTLRAEFTHSNFVLVSTDSAEDSAEIQKILNSHELNNVDSWIFSDRLPERLRFQIDPNWYGELPRTYFYGADHTRTAYSGMLTYTQLQQWLEQLAEYKLVKK